MFFTIMPTISRDIGWASHTLAEIENKVGLYHYQCAGVDVMKIYEMLLSMMDKENGKQLI